ncbi:hypothetical protein [Natrinema salaciae]|uniref:Uncharacterized protein n=1 Tax=Natrinema salaciae TaxID=1186196 RepID=A0A1H8ZVX6_9EURY|nr:hypothetical protein [Natrinema salaciae]SEP68600.1 hypothetical protein SAMN04489841_0279 [Natrinema salaciae]
MSNDDTRGNESPDRPDESQRQTTDYRPILEHLDTQITDLLETITDDETVDQTTRLKAKRHCRELRAELEWLGRDLLEGEGWRVPRRTDRRDGITTVSGPIEAALERAEWDDRDRGRTEDGRTDEEGETDE